MKKPSRVNISLYGALLTEIKILGSPLRVPVVAILNTLNGRSMFLSLILLLYSVTGDNTFDVSNGNILILVAILIGITSFVLSKDRQTDPRVLSSFLKFVYIVFILVSLLQFLGIDPFFGLFALIEPTTFGRATGLSAEPSFYSWIAIYFFALGRTFNGKHIKYNNFMIIIVLMLARSSSLVVLLLIYLLIISIFNLFSNRHLSLAYVLVSAIIVAALPTLEFFSTYYYNTSIGLASLELFGSWREASLFASFYGSDLIGSFSRGEEWAEIIYGGVLQLGNADRDLSWIAFPWSVFSMLCVEFGIAPAIIISALIFYIASKRAISTKSKSYALNTCFVILLGIFLAPKWAIYLFLPFPKVGVRL